MKKITILLLVITTSIQAQIQRIEPANWWVGMKLNQITLLVYGNNIQDLEPTTKYEGVSIVKTEKVENPNYLFVTINIAPDTKVGKAKGYQYVLNVAELTSRKRGKLSLLKIFLY